MTLWGLDLDARSILLVVHIGSIVLGLGSVLWIQFQFVRRGITWGQLQPFFAFTSRTIWIGLFLATASGIVLWLIKTRPPEPVFYAKLGFVAFVYLEGLLIHLVGRRYLFALRPEQTLRDISSAGKRFFAFTGVLSVLGWWGAFAIAILK